jgi:geranylgeranyl pyrophosphate synthase
LNLTQDAYVEIARKKTASLFAASAQCGAIMGDGTPSEIAGLQAYGEAFGIAFQMKDDLLDIVADERSLGKPVGNDLTERKVTIPLIEALAGGDGTFRADVRRFYDGSGKEGIAAIVAGIATQGGLAATRRQIARFAQRAKEALEPIGEGAAKKELARLADALLEE